MSEDEIIKGITNIIYTCNDAIEDKEWYDQEEIESAKEQLKFTEGLLDLYNKEKEKREIAEENHKVLSLDLGQALKELGLYEDTIIADELVLEINKRYINKEKIKEILDKYKFCKVENLKECYKELQELLEERN